MELDKTLVFVEQIFSHFGWYSLALVALTTFIMIPVSLLLKKIFKSESTQRLRKTISSLLVYGVSVGVVSAYTAIFKVATITFHYLVNTAIPIALLAMLLWAIIKVVRDYGFKPLLKLISQSKSWKEGIYKLGVDKKVVDLVIAKADKYLAGINATKAEEVIKQETMLTSQIATEITGFVDGTVNISEVATKLAKAVVSKHSK